MRTILKKLALKIIKYILYIIKLNLIIVKNHYYTQDIIKICDCKHFTVEEIFEEISKKYPEAGKSSIYRNVEELAKKWDLRKIIWIWKKAYFEKNNWNHIHLIDKNTWKIIDLDQNISLPILPENFKISEIDLKIFWEFSI